MQIRSQTEPAFLILKNNILSNLAGGGWNTLLVLLATPVQIAALGIESYGLISLIAVLQIVAGALDFGLASTVTREVAHDSGKGVSASAALVNSAAAVYWLLALAVAAALWLSAGAIPAQWLKAESLPAATIADALKLIAAYLLLRWPIALYAGILSGTQRMGLLNALKSAALTLRLGGGTALLLFKPDLLWLLEWYVATAALELAAFVYAAFCAYPALHWLPRLKIAALRRTAGFSATMYAIALLAMLLTQVDRLAIGNLLGLEALGYYSVAYTAAMGLSLLQTAINNAALPAFAHSHGTGDDRVLVERYERISELMGFVLTPAALTLIFFGHDIFRIWVGAAVADAAYLSLGLLATGFLLNAAFSSCYIFAVAAGKPLLFLRANIIGLLLFVPALLAGILLGGIAGAGAAWLALNLYYLAHVLPRVHCALNLGPARRWLHRNVAIFVYAGGIAFAGGRLLAHLIGGTTGSIAGFACACAAYLWLSGHAASAALARNIHDAPHSARQWIFGKNR